MEYRRLGNSGLKVSTLCLGAMMFGDRTTEDVAARIVDSALDAGVNFIDTADSYAKGGSESVVGNLIAKRRDRWVLATKVQNAMNPKDPNSGGGGRKWITYEIDASLSRLKTDYVDVYYLHRDDLETPLEETVRRRSAISSAPARCAISGSAISTAGASPNSSIPAAGWVCSLRSCSSRFTTR